MTMRPRLLIKRIVFLRPFRPPRLPRTFTQNAFTAGSRPQLPFQAASSRRPIARFLTTERKQWLKEEFRRAGKYTVVMWTVTALVVVIVVGLRAEYLDRQFPSSSEWSWITRNSYRFGRSLEIEDEDGLPINWAAAADWYQYLLKRLEDPNIDGAGLNDQDEGGILVEGIGKTGLDLTKKSEPWRRGYYEVLMGAARAAEHLDGWVRDKSRNIAFPAKNVIGPSNPNPRPVPPESASAPREEDCEPAFDPPEIFYVRALTTRGFTEKQRVDAALAYGAWLDYKGTPHAALEVYNWAIDIATAACKTTIIDKATGILNTQAGNPSANILSAATALGVHHALDSNLSLALPVFLSVLRARRSLPEPTATMRSTLAPDAPGSMKQFMQILEGIFVPPKYPPPPPDGTSPPSRTSEEVCDEAGIMIYIGEILYASKQGKTGKEEGLAWTREAVDIAEEKLRERGIEIDGKKKCQQCLEVGLKNWNRMVRKLALAEQAAKKPDTKSGGWLSFGGSEKKEEVVGRWESEGHVVKERIRRAIDLLNRPIRVDE